MCSGDVKTQPQNNYTTPSDDSHTLSLETTNAGKRKDKRSLHNPTACRWSLWMIQWRVVLLDFFLPHCASLAGLQAQPYQHQLQPFFNNIPAHCRPSGHDAIGVRHHCGFCLFCFWFLMYILFLMVCFCFFFSLNVCLWEGARSRSYRQLWTAMWVLGIEPVFSGRAVSALIRWAISPAPRPYVFVTSPQDYDTAACSMLCTPVHTQIHVHTTPVSPKWECGTQSA